MSSYSIGLSALGANQRVLDILGQNVANATTPGYHRQVADLRSRLPQELGGFQIGMGVEVGDIRRLRSALLEGLLTQQTFQLADTSAQVETLRQIESLVSPGEGSLHERLEELFNRLENLTSHPDDLAQRRLVLGSAAALADEISALAGELDGIRDALDLQLRNSISEANQLIPKIAELNEAIQRAEVRRLGANDLRDQRDQLVNELARFVGVRVVEQDFGQVGVFVSGIPVVLGNRSWGLDFTTDSQGNAVITRSGSTDPISVVGGQLGGLMTIRNQVLTDLNSRLDVFAQELMRNLDSVQATGLGMGDPLTVLFGRRAVSDPTLPLSQASPAFPIQAGSLFVTVTDLATGQQTLSEVTIDPATQSLQDVATGISGVGNLQAIADSQTGTLQIRAQGGFAFSFAGGLDPAPDTSGVTGTTVPTISGVYRGEDNDVFDFTVVGSGTIGVTAGLQLEVRDAAGSVVASLNVGQGYVPGDALAVADGVSVGLSAGTVTDGDTFSAQAIAVPDTAGLLPALGLNTFFAGRDASSIQLNPDLLTSPERLAASRSGELGDITNLQRMTALRDAPLLAGGTQTFSEFYSSIVGDLGGKVQDLTLLKSHQELVNQSLEAERQSISGVDPNEEMVRMMQFQRAFQMAAQYISIVDETLDSLLVMI